MPSTPLLLLFLLTLLSTLSTAQFSPTIIELDQIFPRNETYAPLRYFPLVWGLQNATTAYPFGFKLYWRLSLADSSIYMAQGEGFFPDEEYMDDSYSYGDAPADPDIFHEFPIRLMNFSTGRWELEWKFGFDHNCSLEDPGMPERHYRKRPYQSVEFTIAEGGEVVDILGNWNCEAESQGEIDNAVAFEVSPPHPSEPDQTCPVVNSTTPHPCALQFGVEAVENITAGARSLGRCEDFKGELADFPVTCRNHAMELSAGWIGTLIVLSTGWLAVMF